MEDIAAQGEKAASTSLPSESSTQGSRELLEEPAAAAAAAEPQKDPSDEGLPKVWEAEDFFTADGKEGEENVPIAPCRKDKRAEEDKAIEDAAPKKTRKALEEESTAQKVLQPSLQQTMADVEAIQKLASAAKRKADGKGGASASSGAIYLFCPRERWLCQLCSWGKAAALVRHIRSFGWPM